MKISSITIYPIKSLSGISLTSSTVEKRGLKYDRRWMLTDKNGLFLTQRKHPVMALLQVSLLDKYLVVSHRNHENDSLKIPFYPTTKLAKQVRVWDSQCEALVYEPNINNWFSKILGKECQLVLMPESTNRLSNVEYAGPNEPVSFADGYPFLIIGESSLADLNARLDSPVPMDRFRPNFVFTGGDAFIEDDSKLIQIGSQQFKGVKKCTRCNLTTIDQSTGQAGKEPLLTLSKYRKINNKIVFGQNLCWIKNEEVTEDQVSIGDEVVIF